jgi:hypothetical protein
MMRGFFLLGAKSMELNNLSNDELLKVVDRSNKEVKELAARLEKLKTLLDLFGKHMGDALEHIEEL